MKEKKDDHIMISLKEDVEVGKNGFEDIELVHCALPEVDFDGIDVSTEFLGKGLKYPILIEAMTGGTEQAMHINEAFAHIAEELGIGIEVGSQRPAIENDEVEETYEVVRRATRKAMRIANLGAVQLNYNYGVTECQLAVDMIEADALALHLNPLQEVIQPGGNVNFSGLLPKIEEVCSKLSVPVIVKEVGCGISKKVAEKLLKAGVKCIDVGGFGGTSWTKIEGLRADDEKRELAEIFEEWGIPTAISMLEIRDLHCEKIASGGIRTGIEVAKAIAMGANVVGIALPLLRALDGEGEDGVIDYLYQLVDELKLAMLLSGAGTLEELQKKEYKVLGRAREWIQDNSSRKKEVISKE